jgi:Pvc16 N-terminal domain
VISEVDEALCRVLAQVLPKGTVVRLDPPKPTWQTEKPSQAIDLFLFNLAGDPRGASTGWEEVRDARGAVLSRQEPPRRYQLSYLVTARAPKISEEHELLDTALRALTDGESLPSTCLPDELLNTGMPVLVELDPGGPGPLWTSLGMPARAAFVLTVSAPHRPKPDTDIAPPAESIDLRTHDTTGTPAGAESGSAPPRPAVEKRWKRVGATART